MSKNNNIKSRLENIQKDKDIIKGNPGKVISGIVNQEQETPDFAKIAEMLEARKQEEAKGENDNHIKDTIYVEETIYRSFNALCVRRGDKKKFVNEALSDFVKKKVKELGINK